MTQTERTKMPNCISCYECEIANKCRSTTSGRIQNAYGGLECSQFWTEHKNNSVFTREEKQAIESSIVQSMKRYKEPSGDYDAYIDHLDFLDKILGKVRNV